MAHAMWSGGSGSGERFEGKRVNASRLLNSPPATTPGPKLVGGAGAREVASPWDYSSPRPSF